MNRARGKPLRIPLPQIFVADALRTREQRIVELYRIKIEVAFNILEPLGRIACGILEAQHFQTALILIPSKRGFNIRLAVKVARQGNCALHCQFRPGANGEMGGGSRVSQQHNVAMAPALAQHTIEIEPCRPAQLTRI
jgi:hypothetical protein